MPDPAPLAPQWNIVVVEDDADMRSQIAEFLAGEVISGRELAVSSYHDFQAARRVVEQRRADLVILDLFRGTPETGQIEGLGVLESIKASGFVPVVIYTAKPEAAGEAASVFVRIVGKEAGGLGQVKAQIDELFRLKVPQIHRAIRDHLDRSLASYMWEFVGPRWGELGPLAEKPEFVRLLLQRLAASLAQSDLSRLGSDVFGAGTAADLVGPDKVHPAEFYIKPAVGPDLLLGDIRVRGQRADEYLVVLWPSCDLVSSHPAPGGGTQPPKTTRALCACAVRMMETAEYKNWSETRSAAAKEKVKDFLKNKRDRYHFLPGVWDIPDLLVDFQALEHQELAAVRDLPCLATLASPYAESLGNRFTRYLGRLGTPDIDMDLVERRVFPPPAGGATPPGT